VDRCLRDDRLPCVYVHARRHRETDGVEASLRRTAGGGRPPAGGTGRDLETIRKEFHQRLPVPLGRRGQPEEAAELIAFPASPRASYLTGVTISADGGLLPTL
jgi:NAD(P)-dependent dehydrogenase (short-subunit alcohol dehydrogenase family)